MTMQITPDMVEAALDTWYDDGGAWKRGSVLVTEAENKRFVPCARAEMRTTLEAALKVSAAQQMLEALQACADLAWVETREVEFDSTIMFGHGSVDFDALDSCRQEIHSNAGSFMVWPSQIGGRAKWSAYGGPDGSMWFEKFDTVEQAKDCVVRELQTICPEHPAAIARAVIAAATGE